MNNTLIFWWLFFLTILIMPLPGMEIPLLKEIVHAGAHLGVVACMALAGLREWRKASRPTEPRRET